MTWLPNVKVRLVEASEDGGSKVNDVDCADLFRGSKVTERGLCGRGGWREGRGGMVFGGGVCERKDTGGNEKQVCRYAWVRHVHMHARFTKTYVSSKYECTE